MKESYHLYNTDSLVLMTIWLCSGINNGKLGLFNFSIFRMDRDAVINHDLCRVSVLVRQGITLSVARFSPMIMYSSIIFAKFKSLIIGFV